jgi:imidazolonepropionase-like amidohydrolase
MSKPIAAALPTLALVFAGAAGAEKEDVYAVVGARVVTVSGPVHATATVVIRDGLIEAVGPEVTPPLDARVYDGKGWTLTPGLIDGFGGVGLPAPKRPEAAGRGRPGAAAPAAEQRDPLAPQAMALDQLQPAEALKARDSGVTTALVVSQEGVLPGQSVLVDLVGESAAGMVLRQPAGLHLHMTSLARRYPGSLMGTMALARQALHDARRYALEWAAYEKSPLGTKRPRYDPGLAAWQDVLAGRQRLFVTATRENDVRRALALADEFRISVVVAGATQAAGVAALLEERRLPVLVGVNSDPPAHSGFGIQDDNRERRRIADAERAPARLHEAGVRFGLASGHAPSYLAGIRKAVDRGLPRDAALRAATLGAAEALGVSDRTGSLEQGKLANLVAWSGEPLAKEAQVKLVFVDGEPYEPQPEDEKKQGKGAADAKGKPETKAAEKGDRGETLAPLPPLAPLPVEAAPGATLALVGGTLLTVSPQGTIEKGTILVRDGKIAALGKDVAVPAGARVIDAAGRFVMPGIVDCHSHTAIEDDVNECTDAVTAETRIADVLDQRDVAIYRELAGGVTAANVLHGSCNAIGGQNAVIKLRWGLPPEKLLMEGAPRGIKFALGENPKRSNFRVPGERRYPGTRMGVEATIRKAFEDAKEYQRDWRAYEEKVARGEKPVPPRTDLRLEALRDVLAGKVLVHAHSYRSDEILMLIRLADELGFKVRTFQHVLEGYKVASEIARHGAGASTFSDWWAYKLEAYDAIPFNAALMAARGVKVSLNSDSDELARRLYWEAAKAVKYGGVSEAEALAMITLNPAWQLGIDARVGSLEVGKDADLAVFSAHPFAPDARVEMTLVDGTVYFDRARDLAARKQAAAPKAGAAGGGR